MSRAESTIVKAFTVALATCAVAAPTAVAGQDLRSPDHRSSGAARQDLRSPDARGAGAVVSQQRTYRDLVSPDARDAAAVPPSPEQRTFSDLVSPDARDAARVVLPQPAGVAASVAETGFRWGDAAVGGAIVAGLLALAAGTVGLRRRHDHGMPGPLVSG